MSSTYINKILNEIVHSLHNCPLYKSKHIYVYSAPMNQKHIINFVLSEEHFRRKNNFYWNICMHCPYTYRKYIDTNLHLNELLEKVAYVLHRRPPSFTKSYRHEYCIYRNSNVWNVFRCCVDYWENLQSSVQLPWSFDTLALCIHSLQHY